MHAHEPAGIDICGAGTVALQENRPDSQSKLLYPVSKDWMFTLPALHIIKGNHDVSAPKSLLPFL